HRAAAAGPPAPDDRAHRRHRARGGYRAVLLPGETVTPPPRVLLLVPARTYRAADFILAAERMHLDLVVASDGALPLGRAVLPARARRGLRPAGRRGGRLPVRGQGGVPQCQPGRAARRRPGRRGPGWPPDPAGPR